jgi:formate dehydrogenase maturation protein FdhE
MKNPIAIASFEMEESAARVARKLRDAGFDTRVRPESPSKLTSRDTGEEVSIYRVVVPAFQTARAMSWCREFDAAESLLSHALRCPVCGSTRVAVGVQVQSNADEPGKVGRLLRCDVCSSAWLGILPASPLIGGPAAA